jgi:hypothetical protein
MFKKYGIATIAILLLLTIVISIGFANTKVTISKTDYLFTIKDGNIGIHKQPNGPFAIYYCSESDQGNYIGVIYYNRMGSPIFPLNKPVWRNADRFWQDEEWAADVNNIAWGPDGKYLYVATSNIYGSGGVFELNLLEKKSKRVFPSDEAIKSLLKPEYGTSIVDMDLAKLILKVKLVSGNESKIEQIDISHKN